jgi:hypothetical protein
MQIVTMAVPAHRETKTLVTTYEIIPTWLEIVCLAASSMWFMLTKLEPHLRMWCPRLHGHLNLLPSAAMLEALSTHKASSRFLV